MRKVSAIAAAIICAVVISVQSGAAETRNICTFSNIDYDGIGTSKVIENTVITRVHPRVSLLLRAYHDHRSNWNNTIITAGPVINLDRFHYMEITYGYGRDSDSRRADYASIELTREKPRYRSGLGFRLSSYPDYSYYTLSPSLYYSITRHFALWGKVFASTDSDNNFDQAWWSDLEISPTPHISFRAGFTGGNRLYSPQYETLFGGKADMRFSSVHARIQYSYRETLIVGYLFEQLDRQSRYTDRTHSLIIDFRM